MDGERPVIGAMAPLSRRDVLRLLAGGIAGSALLPYIAQASDSSDARRIKNIGLQLYTVRSALSKDIEGTLAAIAKAGVTEVENFNFYNRDASWWKAQYKANGFTSPSTHEGMPATDEAWKPIFERANIIGIGAIIVPSPNVRDRTDVSQWQRFAERLNSGAKLAKEAGLGFGYHNHDAEFRAVGDTTPYEIITTQTDAGLVKLELDIYWAVKAGQDPAALFAKWPKRFEWCHVKDAGPAPEQKMMDVGAGTIDFKSLLEKARKQGLKHWYIEHDNPTDALTSVAASAAAMKKL
jgi:sugar phosphate isomerase/epimerase